MRILVTGANGQLGNEMQVLAKRIHNIRIISQTYRSLIFVIKMQFGLILPKNKLSLLLIVLLTQQ